MPQQVINNLETGAVVRAKINDNFQELYASVATLSGTVVREITGTSHTLQLVDANAVLYTTNSNPVTITVPTNASVALPAGIFVEIHVIGPGQVTINNAVGVTITSLDNARQSVGRYTILTLRQLFANNWSLGGGLA
jgi:hypothetical protein